MYFVSGALENWATCMLEKEDVTFLSLWGRKDLLALMKLYFWQSQHALFPAE